MALLMRLPCRTAAGASAAAGNSDRLRLALAGRGDRERGIKKKPRPENRKTLSVSGWGSTKRKAPGRQLYSSKGRFPGHFKCTRNVYWRQRIHPWDGENRVGLLTGFAKGQNKFMQRLTSHNPAKNEVKRQKPLFNGICKHFHRVKGS